MVSILEFRDRDPVGFVLYICIAAKLETKFSVSKNCTITIYYYIIFQVCKVECKP